MPQCDNVVCSVCNNVGTSFFDRRRAETWKFAIVLYVLGLCCAFVCVAGLSANTNVAKNTHWASYSPESATGPFVGTAFANSKFYVNIYGISVTGGDPSLNNFNCPGNGCRDGLCSFEDMGDCLPDSAKTGLFSDCKDDVSGFTIMVIIMAVTMLIKGQSVLPRMSRESDSSFNKCKGIITCIIPFIMQGSSLSAFSGDCYADMPSSSNPKYGPGYVCGITVMLINFPILMLHILTPVPPHEESPEDKDGIEVPEMGDDVAVDDVAVVPVVPLTPDEEYRKCFDLFAKGSDMINTRDVGEALNAVGAPHNEDVDLEDENWNAEISYDEFAADDVPMEDRPVNLAGIKALLEHMETGSI